MATAIQPSGLMCQTKPGKMEKNCWYKFLLEILKNTQVIKNQNLFKSILYAIKSMMKQQLLSEAILYNFFNI